MKRGYLSFFTLLLLWGCTPKILDRIIVDTDYVLLSSSNHYTKIARYEVTNKEFRRFLQHYEHQPFIYDSLRWNIIDRISLEFSKNYHSHPQYDNYPIVNITFEAAERYCKWLTESYLESNGEVLFRLPYKHELAKLIANRISLIPSDYHIDYNYEYPANLKYKYLGDDSENYSADGFFLSSDVAQFKQLDLNGILGNVSEFCKSGGVIGGNWNTFPSEVTGVKELKVPDPRVGFRVVMVRKTYKEDSVDPIITRKD